MVVLLAAASLAAGCGSDNNDSSKTSTSKPAAQQPAAGTLEVKMSEFAFDPNQTSAKAGNLTIKAPNNGKSVHEFVLLKTSRDPGSFPVSGGRINEDTLTGVKAVGEITDVAPGQTKQHKYVNLKPGKYAMICNLPGHYKAGMYGALTGK